MPSVAELFKNIATYYIIDLARTRWPRRPDVQLIRLVDDRDLKLALTTNGELLYVGPHAIEAPLDTDGMWDFYADLSAETLKESLKQHPSYIAPGHAAKTTGESTNGTPKNVQGSFGYLRNVVASLVLRYKWSQPPTGGRQTNESKPASASTKSGRPQDKSNQMKV
ncbi:MAG: hypothetical protein Q9165_007842 [Trypethelium subeluteriae]